jgi:15-cis-phytoene synthase
VAADRRAAVSRDTSFYYSFFVLPPRKRSAIIAVWDFCRAVDDAVDEAPDGTSAHTRLSLWRDELAALYTPGNAPSTAQGRALQPYVAEFNLPRKPFDDLIDGVEMDLALVRYQTFAELADYCRRVASAVGLVCVEIFGYRDTASRSYAMDLGMALQLTNIIRDVGDDARRGRIYLPISELKRFDVKAHELLKREPPWGYSERFTALMRFQAERAHATYDEALRLLPGADRQAQKPGLMMANIYRALLREIEADGFNVLHQRISLTPMRKLWIALRTHWRGR